MKIPVIKKLVENYELDDLLQAEQAIVEGEQPSIDIEGDDEGEQLTHALAAIEILSSMKVNDIPMAQALRNYSQRVRKSIS